MANKMKKMRDQLRKIKEGHEAFRLTPDSTPYNEHHRPDPRETTSKQVTRKTVILPIYGFGGIGKTALAQLVFNDTQFRGYDHRVWVYVSQVFDLKKIGNTIISQVSNEGNKNEYTRENINGRLCDLLEDKNTLIVLDDLWETNDFHLNELKLMLNTKGKIKVLVTTRNEDVAKKICTHKPYRLNPLDSTMCWNIIKQRSNLEARGDKDQIEQVGWVIAKKCGGIALAAHALGFLLSGMDLVEWRALSNSDIWTEAFSDNSVLPSLKLTYKNMPPYLRLCFAYCAIFPKGHNIAKASLVHQWIALGFIEPSKTFSSVRLGEKYIRQLVGMSFLQRSILHTEQEVFTMHDMVHDVARSVMDEELVFFNDTKISSTTEQKFCHYALLENYSKSSNLSTILPATLRAVHTSNCSKLVLQGDEFSFTKFLRVLDLTDCSIRILPSSIGKLKQLRFLIAPNIGDNVFPKSITLLPKLKYLDLHGSFRISALQGSISKHACLIHLDLSGCSNIRVIQPEALCGLTKLQFLNLSWCSILQILPENIASLTELQYLNLSNCFLLSQLPSHIGSLTELQYLNLSGCQGLVKLPMSFRNLKNLVHLDLSGCSGVQDFKQVFGGLTKLQYLNLSKIFGRTRVGDNWDGYPETISTLNDLEYLNLSRNSRIDYLPRSLGNLKKLQTLDLSYCRSLRSLPHSIELIDSLEFLIVVGCSDQLKEYLRKSHSRIFQSHYHTSLFTLFLSIEEARGIELSEKQNLSTLTFHWTSRADRLLEDKDVLGELMPPRGLWNLSIQGYDSTTFPTWFVGISHHLPSLVKIELKDLHRCRHLPPLGQLPNLNEVHLQQMDSLTKIDGGFCGGDKGAFRKLKVFTLRDMKQLEEWSTTTHSKGGEDSIEFMFPMLVTLSIELCPMLRLKPCPPMFHSWLISESDKVISSWGEIRHQPAASVSHSFSSSSDTNLEIKGVGVAADEWRLLHHHPTLQQLEISWCKNLLHLPDAIRHLPSLSYPNS
ncbi:hypothetical protein OsI_28511 [Oryza sativa Indica Group]|uniref:Uncharacterized protein n=1 Tax=Oryza sativa subsp. indica TaxID=39946 RepID=B8B8Y7_ORYSI|nr:hypothetical protein OsI_28511 [Oryza sativa Indica Group]